VIGTLTYIRFTRHGFILTLSHPYWYFWQYVPGMRRRKEGAGTSLTIPNIYSVDTLLSLLGSLPLIHPETHVFDFDLSNTLMSATVQFKTRGCTRDEFNRPVRLYAKFPTNGEYETRVEVPVEALDV